MAVRYSGTPAGELTLSQEHEQGFRANLDVPRKTPFGVSHYWLKYLYCIGVFGQDIHYIARKGTFLEGPGRSWS